MMKKERMQRLRNRLALLFVVLLAVCTGFAVYLWVRFQLPAIVWLCIGFTAVIMLLFVLVIGMMHRYMRDLIVQLSDMIAAISDLREEEYFSVLDDKLLSKLQSQVLKLTRLMRVHQEKLESERDEIKSLISDISHQIKTPLANLSMYCTFLQDEDLDELQRKEFSTHLQSQLDKLSWLMENMIKMSRLESGIIQLHIVSQNLNNTILTAVKQVHEKAIQKGITIHFEPETQSLMLPHDSRWTAEAVFNLLDNAVKYTSGGGQVHIRMEPYEFYARVDIQDTGAGLAEAEIPLVFGRFYRGVSSRDAEGVGIGLYLAREIISRQDGYIKVSSKPGCGSTFSIFMLQEQIVSEVIRSS